MTTKFDMVCNDLKPSIRAQLKYKDGTIVNLTDCSVNFHMSNQEGNVLINEPASILIPPTDGWVQYDWQDARDTKKKDTDVDPGIYPAEFEVTFADGKNMTFPTKKDFVIVFRKQIV
jgi:hypothetical protein